MKTHIYIFGLAFLLVLSPISLGAAEAPLQKEAQPMEQPIGEEVGYGFGSVVANIFYIPAKVTYAGLGLMTGGLGYLLSAGRPEVANNIIYPAVRGDYVITPSHLKGERPVIFIGAPPPEPQPQQVSAVPQPQP
jgi:hypothetical protein